MRDEHDSRISLNAKGDRSFAVVATKEAPRRIDSKLALQRKDGVIRNDHGALRVATHNLDRDTRLFVDETPRALPCPAAARGDQRSHNRLLDVLAPLENVGIARSERSDGQCSNDFPRRFVRHARVLLHVELRTRLHEAVAPEYTAAPKAATPDLVQAELVRHSTAYIHPDGLGDACNKTAVVGKLRHHLISAVGWRGLG